MARSPTDEILLPLGQLSTTCSIATEVAQWATRNCSRPQSPTDQGVGTVNLIDWPLPPALYSECKWCNTPLAQYKCTPQINRTVSRESTAVPLTQGENALSMLSLSS